MSYRNGYAAARRTKHSRYAATTSDVITNNIATRISWRALLKVPCFLNLSGEISASIKLSPLSLLQGFTIPPQHPN